ncbi:MAG: molybdenum cofactor biosynthesis protein MoaE [Terracidiphilus sp.]
MNQVRVQSFGVLKDLLDQDAAVIALPNGATVGDLLARIAADHPAVPLRGIAVSVNAEYADRARLLEDGDEVGLLPPVSGGAGAQAGVQGDFTAAAALTRAAIEAEEWIEAAKADEDGAVVVFDGIVRNNSRGRRTLHLDYEAYEEMALKQMTALTGEARTQFGVRQVTIVHRLGRLEVGDRSVLIVVASAHRAQAFDACRWVIDTLKKTVPIWKKETFVDGAVWADGEAFPAGIGMETLDAP